MRTLIVDNHDSFTLNLAHLVATITGRWPEVVANDDPDFDPHDLGAAERVIISPGPGHPARLEDFGHSADVVATARRHGVPVLGVCLGHQGIAHLAGGRVERAPAPRHGRLSPVHHDGRGLFDGIPSPMPVVRYHSLEVSDLPDEFEPVAFADDGVLMAFAHRDLPVWGVQFHPESICTEHGGRMLANFLLGPGHSWTWEPPASAARSTPAGVDRTPTHRVLVRELAEAPDAESAFATLFADAATAFWLDSSTADLGADDVPDHRGRYAIMGDARGPLAAQVTADVTDGTVTLRDASGEHVVAGEFLAWLEADLAERRVEVPDLPFAFALGWVGYLGYELKAECGGRAAHRSPDPDAGMVFADRALVIDHRDRRAWLLALVEVGCDRAGDAWFDEIESRLAASAGPPAAAAALPVARALGQRHDRDTYLSLIDECQRLIEAGETYEVCLTTMLHGRVQLDPWASYRRLRRLSPAPYGAYLSMEGLAILSTSPERFVRVDADGSVESKPIKGTRPRGTDPRDDVALRDALAADEKDRAENLMVVDMVRHDLGATAATGSVQVEPLFAVETHARAHQLVSTVRSRLAPGFGAVACVRAAFPGGSMTGAPKERTMEIIDRLEGGPRGVYSGALGYFSLSGAVDLGMVIRTLVVRPGEVSFGVGGAIVALSDPDAEYEEIAVKATALTTLLGCEFPGRARTAEKVA